MSSFNRGILVGNLGDDPVIRRNQDGTCRAKLSLATSEYYNGKEQTTWHQVMLSGKTAETCEKYLKKGSKVLVEGKIVASKFVKDDGSDGYWHGLQGFSMQILSPKEEPKASQDSLDDVPF